ncbi:D-2-hydroxyacid dehydrogenase [Alkalibacterium pelagium]|uniref:D-lactate dehydrogenase n=1 Tax=Alkalibacterium pelagium TaxID=426702 RepID=A0A1H7J650_9LACT|nr:D-2-hydroxyacid dehydrogenase [Alkalibacterium pelagium]GEN50257.1 lactate dehydrogenase [Alkalibacterium pelagium]SEK69347.1 D-lactate dehydrogenase [Alkalibacterium pelagium]
MKLIMFSTRDDEKPAVNKWSIRNGVEVRTVKEDLTLDTVSLVEGFDGVCIQQRTDITNEAVYKRLSDFGIKQLALRTAGYDIINMDLAERYNMKITNVPAYSPRSVAELVLTQTMRLIRQFPSIERDMAEGDFRWSGRIAREIHTMTIGIIGAGRIGGTTARLFHALGATVIAYDPVQHDELRSILTYKESKTEVLAEADIVSLHVPLDSTTINLIDASALNVMRGGAFLINAARGPVVDTSALIESLQSAKLAGAALDTLTNEQNFFNQDLRGKVQTDKNLTLLMNMKNVLLTPHIGFYTTEAVQNMVDIALDNALDIIHLNRSVNEVV